MITSGTASRITAAYQDLAAALAEVSEVAKRVSADVGSELPVLPAVVIGPPSLTFDGYGTATDATFLVYVVVAANAQALPKLWDLVPPAYEAIEANSDGVVRRADPGVWTAGTADLPCYEIAVEYPL